MAAAEPRLDSDDEQIPMTVKERTVWASLVSVLVSSGVYFALMVPRLLSQPVTEISWVRPLLWTMGLGVAGTVLLTVVLTVAAEANRNGGSSPASRDEVTSDVRDQEIGRLGWRASMSVISVGSGAALVLTMLDAHTFWIGNLLFLVFTVGAVVEATTKLRLYRRGF
ncbi:MAG TPA: hypothetical protein VNV66_16090 [Pilimelia sp.]|nr:hypothetical protein [Pilimelia sp.]